MSSKERPIFCVFQPSLRNTPREDITSIPLRQRLRYLYKRLIKTPKLHLGDTGLAGALLGLEADGLWNDRALFGRLLETFVYQELRRQASRQEYAVSFSHFHDKDKVEADLVLQTGTTLAGVEVKASSTVTANDFKGLRKLQTAAAGKFFRAWVVLYDGGAVVPFGKTCMPHRCPASGRICESGERRNTEL